MVNTQLQEVRPSFWVELVVKAQITLNPMGGLEAEEPDRQTMDMVAAAVAIREEAEVNGPPLEMVAEAAPSMMD